MPSIPQSKDALEQAIRDAHTELMLDYRAVPEHMTPMKNVRTKVRRFKKGKGLR
ncbi:hypothetical protein [Enterovibrio norvegicus]|uniref:hypothetical protein n=1 Tax=Enterovibrio norvegicus TaxID=188144 RepID=UPI0035513580